MDVDGTLYDQSAVRRRMAWRLAKFCVRNPAQGRPTLRAIQAYRCAQEQIRATGDSLASQQLAIASRSAGQPEKQIQDIVSRWLETEPLEAIGKARLPGLIEFCKWAKSLAIPLAVVSDYPAREKLEALEISTYVSAVVSAQDQDLNSFKPSPSGILKALRQIDVAPSEAIYVGDRADVDVLAANAAGATAILIGTKRRYAGAVSIAGWADLRTWVERRI